MIERARLRTRLVEAYGYIWVYAVRTSTEIPEISAVNYLPS